MSVKILRIFVEFPFLAYSIDREAIATAFHFSKGSVREMIATDQWNKIVCTKYLTVHIISAIQQ